MTTLVLLSAGSAVAAPISYLIGVDTSSLPANTSGFLDFQFNPADPGSLPATAVVSNFTTDGTLVAVIANPTTTPPVFASPQFTAATVSGSLVPGPLILGNGSSFNQFSQQFTFGTFLSFVLSLSGPALSAPDPTLLDSTFSLSLEDAIRRALLSTGPVVSVDVLPTGLTTVTTFLNGSGPSVVTVAEAPEPGSILLLSFGTAGLVFLRKILPKICDRDV